jgi:hypothetical protein
MHRTAALETVRFRRHPGTEPVTLPAAAARPGFLERRLIRGDDGGWTDPVAWADPARATAAAETRMVEPAFGAFCAVIDPEGREMRHDAIVRIMP